MRWILALFFYIWILLLPGEMALTSHPRRRHTSHHHSGELDDIDDVQNVTSRSHTRHHQGLSHIPEIVINPGDELVLNCELKNISGPVVWLQNGAVVNEEDYDRYTFSKGTGSFASHLKIDSVIIDDDGLWQCQEERKDKVYTSKPIWVIVLVVPNRPFLLFERRQLASFARLTIREKNEIVVECVINGGNPAPRVEWFLGSDNVTNSSQTLPEYSKQSKVYHTVSVIKIDVVNKKHHNKSLSCVVHHAAADSSSNASLRLNVEYSPSFSISRIPGFGYLITEGIAVSLKCDIDANPPSSPIWKKDEGDPPVSQSDDGYINFTSIDRTDSGWYKCITKHPFGEFSSIGYFLNVRYEVEITQQPPEKVDVGLGDSIRLQCGADGKPPPAICWAKQIEGGRLETVGVGEELSLDRILYQEAGTYRCVAMNRIGLEEKRAETHNVNVIVTGHPVVYPVNKTLIAVTGKPSSLSVEFCGNPAPRRAFWVTQNVMLNPGDIVGRLIAHNVTESGSPHCYYAVLTILDVKAADAGDYMFLVKNEKGIDEGTVWLNITQASFSVSMATMQCSGLLYILVQIFVIVVNEICVYRHLSQS